MLLGGEEVVEGATLGVEVVTGTGLVGAPVVLDPYVGEGTLVVPDGTAVLCGVAVVVAALVEVLGAEVVAPPDAAVVLLAAVLVEVTSNCSVGTGDAVVVGPLTGVTVVAPVVVVDPTGTTSTAVVLLRLEAGAAVVLGPSVLDSAVVVCMDDVVLFEATSEVVGWPVVFCKTGLVPVVAELPV